MADLPASFSGLMSQREGRTYDHRIKAQIIAAGNPTLDGSELEIRKARQRRVEPNDKVQECMVRTEESRLRKALPALRVAPQVLTSPTLHLPIVTHSDAVRHFS